MAGLNERHPSGPVPPIALNAKDTGTMNATTTTMQPMPAPPANPGPRVRCLIAIADTSLSAFEKLRLSEEAIAAQPPRANLPYVRALVKYLGQIAVAEAEDQVRKIARGFYMDLPAALRARKGDDQLGR